MTWEWSQFNPWLPWKPTFRLEQNQWQTEIRIDSFAVSLHSPNGRHLPAFRAVQGDCQWPLKNCGNPHPIMHCMWRVPQSIFGSVNHIDCNTVNWMPTVLFANTLGLWHSPEIQANPRLIAVACDRLTHGGQNKMVTILQTAFWNAFSWKKNIGIFIKEIHWSLFLMVQVTIRQCWFR